MQARSAVLITLLFTPLCLHAQTAQAPSDVEIRITDTSGAVIAGAEVAAKPTVNGSTISAKTDGSGTAKLCFRPALTTSPHKREPSVQPLPSFMSLQTRKSVRR
jgi:hypothetical protein